MKEIGSADHRKLAFGSTIARRIRIRRVDDENGPCGGSKHEYTAKFSSVPEVYNHFSQKRHVVARQVYKQRRSAALAKWPRLAGLMVVSVWVCCAMRR
jgi:hypothetical protein